MSQCCGKCGSKTWEEKRAKIPLPLIWLRVLGGNLPLFGPPMTPQDDAAMVLCRDCGTHLGGPVAAGRVRWSVCAPNEGCRKTKWAPLAELRETWKRWRAEEKP